MAKKSQAQKVMHELDQYIQSYIREKPYEVVTTAFVAGIIAGVLLRK